MNSSIIQSQTNPNIIAIGEESQAGTYLLQINLQSSQQVIFGRFKGGKNISLPLGNYIYIGSALAQKGATTLGNRISRHCDRQPPLPEHSIRSDFRRFCDSIGIQYAKYPSPKTLFWNIDHLTNLTQAHITGIIFIRSSMALENTWSEFLEKRQDTRIIEKGLGANDSLGHTHLQHSELTVKDWRNLPIQLPK